MRRTLMDMKRGERAVVTGIHGERGLRRSLGGMGVRRGAEVEMCGGAPFGDPVWIRAGGTFVSMRRSTAALIEVRLL